MQCAGIAAGSQLSGKTIKRVTRYVTNGPFGIIGKPPTLSRASIGRIALRAWSKRRPRDWTGYILLSEMPGPRSSARGPTPTG